MAASRDLLTTVIALAVCAVWSIVAVTSLITQEYTPLTVVTPVMLIVSGFLFGLKINRNGNGNGKGSQ